MKEKIVEVPNGQICVLRIKDTATHPQYVGRIMAYGLRKNGTWKWQKRGWKPQKRG